MVKKLDDFNCFVKNEGGKLFKVQIQNDGSAEHTFGQVNWIEVKTPPEEFIVAANKALGTNFTEEDFLSGDLHSKKTLTP